MQESMVKFLLVLIALVSIALGGVFLIIPGWYITFGEAEATNVAWLRQVGANIMIVQGLGSALVAFRRRDTNPLLAFITLQSTVATGVLWYSLIVGEFSAEALWTIIVPGIFATAGVLVYWVAWFSRRRSVQQLGGSKTQIGSQSGSEAAVPVEELPPDAEASAGGASDAGHR